MTETRPTKHEYYLDIARAVAKRSTCRRRQYGAVIVNNDEIVATGYNGAPRGLPDCLERGSCWREDNGVPHGEQYEKCVSVHAEQNAIISAARAEMIGSTIYVVGFENGVEIHGAMPCTLCMRMIRNAGIEKIYNTKGAIYP